MLYTVEVSIRWNGCWHGGEYVVPAGTEQEAIEVLTSYITTEPRFGGLYGKTAEVTVKEITVHTDPVITLAAY